MIRKALHIMCLTLLGAGAVSAINHPRATGEHWKLSGNLSEACSCRVPCGCNFGAGPSPHDFCWTIFALEIKKGRYGKVKLDGMHLVAAHGDRSVVWYIDRGATPQQFAALKSIAHGLRYHTDLPWFFESASIKQEVTDKGSSV